MAVKPQDGKQTFWGANELTAQKKNHSPVSGFQTNHRKSGSTAGFAQTWKSP